MRTAPDDPVGVHHGTGEFCGTCHDVGNVAVTKQPDGTYLYNNIGERTPDEDPQAQFPLETDLLGVEDSATSPTAASTWVGALAAPEVTVVSTCQDCHMPKRASAQACHTEPARSDAAVHEFAGASAWVLEIIGQHYATDPEVDPVAIEEGRQRAIAMVEQAASLDLTEYPGALEATRDQRVGTQAPDGPHRRPASLGQRAVLRCRRPAHSRIRALRPRRGRARYEATTTVYEMHLGLSPFAASVTGLPAGPDRPTWVLADTIVWDSADPPTGV